MANPLIAVTWTDDLVERSREPGENALKYLAILVAARLTPVLLTPGTGAGAMPRVDGLLLTGGPDITPERYGAPPHERLGPTDPALDALELDAFEAARQRHLPVLGICRGQQLLNVALGGTLVQHVDHPQWDLDASTPSHEVTISRGTHLHRLLGTATAHVNSGHHQAVDVVAESLTVAARSPDGVVEALEAEQLLVMGVQWHPEEMPADETTRRLMAGFAEWAGAAATAQVAAAASAHTG